MKDLIEKISKISRWYGIAVIIVYSILVAEFFSLINDLCTRNVLEVSELVEIFLKIGYFLSIICSIAAYVMTSFMFHLVALLFDGKQKFSCFLKVSSYLYIIPIFSLFISIFMLEGIEIANNADDLVSELICNRRFQLASNLVNYSFVPFYALSACVIYYLYNIKWLYAIISVIIPVIGIWGISEIFKML